MKLGARRGADVPKLALGSVAKMFQPDAATRMTGVLGCEWVLLECRRADARRELSHRDIFKGFWRGWSGRRCVVTLPWEDADEPLREPEARLDLKQARSGY